MGLFLFRLLVLVWVLLLVRVGSPGKWRVVVVVGAAMEMPVCFSGLAASSSLTSVRVRVSAGGVFVMFRGSCTYLTGGVDKDTDGS